MWGHHADSGTSTCGTPAFSTHHLVPIASRCTHLQKIDLTGIEIGGMLAGTSMSEMVQLVRSSEHLVAFRARAKAPADRLLVHALALLQSLTSLSLANTDVTDEALAAVAAGDQLYFPSLERLSVAHCSRLTGSSLVCLVQAVPSLRALSCDGCAQIHPESVAKLGRINLSRRMPVSISAMLHKTSNGFQHAGERAPGPLGANISPITTP